MTKRKIIIGNWKMHPVNSKEAEKLFSGIQKSISKAKKTEVLICAPFLYLEKLKKLSKKLKLGAQDSYPGNIGAFTGEISVKMLANLGVSHTIVGHSERRVHGETNEDVNKKIKSLISEGIIPILCVGERERDPEHSYLGFVKTQIEECLSGVSKTSLSKVIIAYEPIWAIGSDAARPGTPAEFLEMSIFIKKILTDKFGGKAVEDMRIIYGGSADPENVFAFLRDGKADGFLAGRDSLNVKKFAEIVNITENAKY